MIPSGWSGFLAFILFVAPGLAYDLMRARTVVPVKETTFREISRVVLVSAACSTPAALTVLVAVWAFERNWVKQLPTLQELVTLDSMLLGEKLFGTIAVIVGFVVVSMLISRALVLFKSKSSQARLSTVSGWTVALREHNLPTTIPHVTLKTGDGLVWTGQVSNFSANLELADREIVLTLPFSLGKDGEAVPYDSCWQRIVISANEIQWMAVSYQPATARTIADPEVDPDNSSMH